MNDIERELRDLGERTAENITYREVPRARIVRRARLRRALTVAGPVTAALLLALVVYPRLDAGEGPASRPVSLAAAAEATEKAGTARLEVEFVMERPSGTYTTDGTGEVDFDRGRSHVQGTVTGPSGSQELQAITIGRTTFQRFSETPDDEKWVRIRMNEAMRGVDLGSGDPAAFLGYLESVSDDITDLGEEELDGVRVRHLRAIIDVPSFLGDRAPGGMDVEFDPMEVWIDDRNRLRQMAFGSSVEDTTMTFTMRFTDFGIPVDITAPAPEDVTDRPLGGTDGSSVGEDSGAMVGTYVTGPDGLSGPYVFVEESTDSPLSFVCFTSFTDVTKRAAVVHESSGRAIVTFGAANLTPTGGTEGSAGCVSGGLTDEDARALIDDPSGYLLRITTEEGDLTTELTRARPAGSD